VDRNVEQRENVVNGSGCDHEARINCPAHNSSQRIPGTVIKPIQELVEIMLHHVCSSTIIEPNDKEAMFSFLHPEI
jgi:hypothetical protein